MEERGKKPFRAPKVGRTDEAMSEGVSGKNEGRRGRKMAGMGSVRPSAFAGKKAHAARAFRTCRWSEGLSGRVSE